MLNEQLIEKLDAWIEANPESADTPFMDVSTGEEYTLRGLLGMLRASAAGETQLSESFLSGLGDLENWIGGL
jgi:hypothetical protein